MTEILQTMPFETNRHNLQCFGEDMRIPCTAEEIEKFIGCYFWIGIVMPNQQFFGKKTSVTLGSCQSSRVISLKHSFELFTW